MQCVIPCGGPALPSLLGAVTLQPREQTPAAAWEQFVGHWMLMTLNLGWLDAVPGEQRDVGA